MKADNHPNLDSLRWSLIESLYHSARELKPETRQSFLANSCSGDESLLKDVLSLIHSDDIADSFLEEPAFSQGLRTLRLPREELAGTSIDHYELKSRLGSGGMGDVYLAYDSRLERRVALKLLNSAIPNDERSMLRFKQEARAASAISHRNVAHIYGFDETDGRQFITMEYVAGPTLRQVLKQGAVEIERAVNIVAQILSAVAAAHRVRVVHRDIKPENIIIAEDGTVKVLDFGLAKVVQPITVDDDPQTHALVSLQATSELLMGTAHYMSPEQVRRDPIDVRTDLWSVGVVLYELLCGRRPFPGQDHVEVMSAVLTQPPQPFSSVKRPVPQQLQELTLKALSKSPEDRFQTADEMLAALEGTEQPLPRTGTAPRPEPIPVRAQSPLEIALDDAATSAHRRNQATKPLAPALGAAPASRRFTRLQQGVAVALLLALGGGTVYFLFFWHRARAFNLAYQPLVLAGVTEDLALSPDGKWAASVQTVAGKQSIHLTDVATRADAVIVPATGRHYAGLSFSPDGNFVYFLENKSLSATLYRVAKEGGKQWQLLTNVDTAVTFSPDGKQIAFFRGNQTEQASELIVAQADGSDARPIARRDKKSVDQFPVDVRGVGPIWSPDGTKIACPTMMQGRQPQETLLYLITVDGKQTERLGQAVWYQISQMAWLGDNSGLIIAAKPTFALPSQLSFIYPNGTVRPLSNDLNNYTRISAARDSRQLLTLSQISTAHVWGGSAESGGLHILGFAKQNEITEVGDTSQGNLVYTVNDGASNDLWLMDPVRESSRPLTSGPGQDWQATISPDGNQVVFVSTRSGKINLWTTALTDPEPHQLTTGSNDDMPVFSPDGKWVFYRTGQSIKRMPSQGGAPEIVFDQDGISPTISPDGRFLAAFVYELEISAFQIRIVDIASRTSVRTIDVPETTEHFKGLHWTPDGKSLAYVSVIDGIDNIWLQPVDSGPAVQRTSLSDGAILSFTWSPNTPRQLFVLRTLRTDAPTLISLS